MGCFLPEKPAATTEGAAATAAGTEHHVASAAVASGSSQRSDTTQLRSVMPVVDFAINRAVPNSPDGEAKAKPPAPHQQTGRTSTNSLSTGTIPPVRTPPTPNPGAFRDSSGTLPWSSASGHSGCSPGMPALDQAPCACLSPRLISAMASAELTAPSATPVEGGQFMSQDDQVSAGVTPDTNHGTAVTPLGKLTKQLSDSTPSAASVSQHGRRQSISSPSCGHSFNSLYSLSHSRSSNTASEAPITPNQVAGQLTHVRRDAEDVSQSKQPPAAAGGALRAGHADALDHKLPQGRFSQPNQAKPLPAIHVAAQPLEEDRLSGGLQDTQTWLSTNPEGHWQPLRLSHPLPPVEATIEGHERQSLRGLERQSPAESPTTPQDRKPTQRVLHFSPMPVMQARAEGFHSSILSRVPAQRCATVVASCSTSQCIVFPKTHMMRLLLWLNQYERLVILMNEQLGQSSCSLCCMQVRYQCRRMPL